MRQSEAGYATVSVAALCAALSVIALAFMNLSSSRTELDVRIVSQLQTDAKLEGALHLVIADIVHRKQSFNFLSAGANQTFAGDTFHIIIEHEGDKLNLNSAEISDISRELSVLKISQTARQEIARSATVARGSESSGFLSFQELQSEAISVSEVACLRKTFTLYQSPRPLSRAAREGRDGLDGIYLRFQIETFDRSRGLDATVLLTGDTDDPIWIFDFTRYHPLERKECAYA